MVKKQLGKIFILFLIAFIFLSTFLSMEAQADSSKQRVFDEANLLSDTEIEKVEKLAAKYSNKRNTEFIIVTVEDSEKDLQIYMDDFYDEQYGEMDENVVLLGLNMTERDVILSSYSDIRRKLDPDRLTIIREKITPSLSNGDYFNAFESFITLSAKYMQYREGVNPANPLFNTWVQLAIGVGIAAAIVWAMARSVEPRMTTTSTTYRDMDRTKILGKRDQYIRTTVTKRRKPKQSSSGGGGRGGGGSIGRTSGGTMRSSSRGKF
ncbi:TPM domain-containing protein [Pseudogracilibacillus sp. SE30717A]|uniref:TPM domain-containing protein n=1 Tax=Pseudogracilibacillus sp. SE30717A TaxID=3098293 RepID=UPI00300E6AFF